MAVLNASVEADVPARFADDEWTEYIMRSLYGSEAEGFSDVSAALSELDADSGTVSFRQRSDVVRVSVTLDYTPGESDPADDIERAQSRLESDLRKYRTFLLRRCAEEACRNN